MTLYWYAYLEQQVQSKSNSGNGGSIEIDIETFVHIHVLTVTQVGVSDFIANILADAEGNEGKGGGKDEVEDKFNPVVDGEESDFVDVVLCKSLKIRKE